MLIDENRRLDGIAGENEWQAAFDGISEWISIHDKDFRIVRANKALAEALQTRRKRWSGNTAITPSAARNQTCSGCPQNLVQQTGMHQISRVFLPRWGFYSDVSIWPLLGADGEVDKTIHIIRDGVCHNNLDIDADAGRPVVP